MKLKAKIYNARWGGWAFREAWDLGGFFVNRVQYQSLTVTKCFFGLNIRAGFLEVVCLFMFKEINSKLFCVF